MFEDIVLFIAFWCLFRLPEPPTYIDIPGEIFA
jgi:hypothetical protein